MKLFKTAWPTLILFALGISLIGWGWHVVEGRFVGWSDKAFNTYYAFGVVGIIAGALSIVGAMYRAIKYSGKKES